MDSDALRALLLEKQTLLLEQHAIVVRQQTELNSQKNEIESLKLLIMKLKRMQFGRSSEKLSQQIEQLELRLEDLETKRAAERPTSVPESTDAVNKPPRRPLPAALPRETQTLEPAQTACPDCGGTLARLSEDVSEMLEYVPAQYKVIRTVRPKLSCRRCDRIVQQPAPHRPIAGGLAGPGMLAHVIVGKYSDHLPLYRQSEIYEREGVDIERSTLADWVGGATRTLEPLVERLRRYVLDARKLHADDTLFLYWLRVMEKRKQAGSGLTSGTIALRAAPIRRRYGLPIRQAAVRNIQPTTFRIIAVYCRPMLSQDSIGSMSAGRLSKPHVGRTCAGSFTTSMKRTNRRLPRKPWTGSPPSTRSRKRSVDVRRLNAAAFEMRGRDRCSNRYRSGSKSRYRSCPRNPN